VVAWQPGPPLAIGLSFEDGKIYPTAKIDGVPVAAASLDIQPGESGAVIDVAIEPGQDFIGGALAGRSWPLPVKSRIVISPDGNSFEGTMYASLGGEPIFWHATATAAAPALHAMANRPATPPVPQDLSLSDLMSLHLVGAADIARTHFNDYIRYGMHDGWRDKLFGFNKSAPDEETAANYNKHASLFTDHVSDAVILRQLAGMSSDRGGPSTPISAADQLKLDYFFCDGIMATPDYNDMSVTQIAWERAAPRLRDYLTSPMNPSWAKQLFEAMTSPKALSVAVLSYNYSNDLTQINRTADLLLALSPNETETLPTEDGKKTGKPATLATLFHMKVLSALGIPAMQQMVFPEDAKGQQEFAEHLAAWFEKTRKDLANRIHDPEMPEARRAMDAQLEIELTEAARLPDGMRSLAFEVTTGIASARGPASNPRSLLGRVANWAETNKRVTGLKKAVAVGSAFYALSTVIAGFNNWNSGSDKEKARLVVMTSELPTQLLSAVADIPIQKTIAKFFERFASDRAAVNVIERGRVTDVAANQTVFTRLLRWLGPAMKQGAAEESSAFWRMFSKESRFMKGFAVLASAATVGFSAYKIFKDRDAEDKDVALTLDSLQLIADTMMLTGSIAAILASESAVVCPGPVGAVCGVVLMLVAIFIPRPAPKKPSDDYMNERGNDHLKSLDSPPVGWRAPVPAAA
jgi:hypothetical protein